MPVVGKLVPFWQTADGETVRLFQGDAAAVLRKLPPRSVHCVVTSPPYWGLRDYGTGVWKGGNPTCSHEPPEEWLTSQFGGTGNLSGGVNKTVNAAGRRRWYNADGSCQCGAVRIDKQIGSEPVPDCGTHGQVQCGACYVCALVSTFREVRRVLRDDGTFWLNLGDSYTSGGRSSYGPQTGKQQTHKGSLGIPRLDSRLPSGNLVGVPWRVALALQADGWTLRQDVIWAKPSPMPESVKNRCTRAHEHVFLLTKSTDYFYDPGPLKERAVTTPHVAGWQASPPMPGGKTMNCRDVRRSNETMGADGLCNKRDFWSLDDHRGLFDWLSVNYPSLLERYLTEVSHKGDVWRVSSQGYPGTHFATFPPKLIEPMILAGTSAKGCCTGCGAPWRRLITEVKLRRKRPNDYVKRTGMKGTGNSCANSVAGTVVRTLGWLPSCSCQGVPMAPDEPRPRDVDDVSSEEIERHERWLEEVTRLVKLAELLAVAPCIVLDPFIGSGTTAAVCIDLGRRCWGIDLSANYLRRNAVPRVEGCLLQRPGLSRMLSHQTAVIGGGVVMTPKRPPGV